MFLEPRRILQRAQQPYGFFERYRRRSQSVDTSEGHDSRVAVTIRRHATQIAEDDLQCRAMYWIQSRPKSLWIDTFLSPHNLAV
jgi:hypothetical protein